MLAVMAMLGSLNTLITGRHTTATVPFSRRITSGGFFTRGLARELSIWSVMMARM